MAEVNSSILIHCRYDKMIPIESFIPHEMNANEHPKSQIDLLARLIKYQGVRYPIIISNLSGKCVSGHGRKEALSQLGFKLLPVVYQDFEDVHQELAFLISDNKIQELAETNMDTINKIAIDMPDTFDLNLLGIPDFFINDAEKEVYEDEAPEVDEKNVKTKLGDIYILGDHRLMCGDSTDKAKVEKLMNGERADLYLTDCPYGVSMEARENSSMSTAWKNKDRVYSKIKNDNQPLSEMKVFWKDVASAAIENCTDEASYYWFACQGGDQMMMMMSLGDAGWAVKHELIWLKDQMCFGRSDYHYKHEPIIYGWKRKGKHNWYGDRKQVSVIECKRPKKSDLHPTMKPVELLERLLGNSSAPSAKVLDTFGGSGSTLIACEKTNRKCFMMELDPYYCDVIVSRWVAYTGKTKIKLNDVEQNWTSEPKKRTDN